MSPRLISHRIPYVPITISLRQRVGSFEALLDTGFEGEIVVPAAFVTGLGSPTAFRLVALADGSQTTADLYCGSANLGALGQVSVEILALGDDGLIGLRLANRFKITLDHGRELVVEP